MKVAWSDRARQDLDEIFRFILDDDPRAAPRIRHAIAAGVDRLARFPGIGRPGRMPDTRELVVAGTPYVVLYERRDETLYVPAVLHGARRWPPADD